MTVEWVPIGEVAEMVRTPVEIDPDRSYRRIGLYSWAKGFLHRPAAPGSDMGSLRYFTFPEGSLVLSNIQAWEGAIGVAGESERGFVASNRFLPYVPDSQLDVGYWFHFLASPRGMEILQKASPGTTMRNRTLRRDLFEAARIPLPDLPTQRAIASRLDLIGGARHRVSPGSSCSRAADAILAEALSSGVERPLGDGLRRRQDAALVEESVKYSMAGVRNAGKGVFDSGVILGSQTKYRHLRPLHPGDLVYPKLGAWAGAFAVVPQDCEGRWVSPEFVTYQIDTDVLDPDFLRSLVAWDAFVDRVAGLSVGTNVNRRRLAPETLESLPVRLPSVDQQHRLGQQLAVIRQADDLLERRAHLLDSLLPAARKEEFRHLLGS